jgi:hypothetical protein
MEQETTFIYSPLVNIDLISQINTELTLRVDNFHYLRCIRRAYARKWGETDNLSPHGRERCNCDPLAR